MNARKRGGYKSVFTKVLAQMDPARILDRDTLISDFLSTHARARFADVRRFIEYKLGGNPQDAPTDTPEIGKADAPRVLAGKVVGLDLRLRQAERLLFEFKCEIDFWLMACDETEIRQSFSEWRKLVTRTNEHFKRFSGRKVKNGG